MEGDDFLQRHLGPRAAEEQAMLAELGCASVDELIDEVVPRDIRMQAPLELPAPAGEAHPLRELRSMMEKNSQWRSFIGQG